MRISLTSVFVDDPIKAHAFYTGPLGFQSKEFNAEAQLAIVVSAEDPKGTALLLEPRGESFALEYQQQVYKAGLPVIIMGAANLAAKVEALKSNGVRFRDDLDRPDWGLQNMFEDTCGNIIMLEERTEV